MQHIKKTVGVCTVHLSVVELKGYRQKYLEAISAVSAPHNKGIVE